MTLVVGLDCATEPRKTGLALAYFENDALHVDTVEIGRRTRRPACVIAGWIDRAAIPALLALDAPLGWPAALSATLGHHRAGDPLPADPDDMFNRATDKEIAPRFGRRPLEVGANLIARTAHAALSFLQELRDSLNTPVPLSWASGGAVTGLVAIEVYPATTRLAHGLSRSGGVLADLPCWVQLGPQVQASLRSAYAGDALLCAMAGADFLSGRALGPANAALAAREGWIWATSRPAQQATVGLRPTAPGAMMSRRG